MSDAIRCKRCNEKLPAGDMDCRACLAALSDQSFLDYQRQYVPTIFANQCDITLVYVPAGHNGQRTRLWHLKRLGDPQHAYCGCTLDPNYKSDRCRYFEFLTTQYRCPLCEETLDRLIREETAKRLPPVIDTLDTDQRFLCSD